MVVTLTGLAQASHFSTKETESQRKAELELVADPDCNTRILGVQRHFLQ